MLQAVKITDYLHKYHSGDVDETTFTDADLEFLEVLRTADARASRIEELKDAQIKGIYSMEMLRAIYVVADTSNLSNKLLLSIEENIKKYESGEHGRACTKAVWKFPLTSYLPWNKVESMVISGIQKIFDEMKTVPFRIVNGKGYVMLDEFANNPAIEKVRTRASEELKSLNIDLVKNTEPPHVTLINSDVLAKLQAKGVEVKDRDFDATKFRVEDVCHTLSLDYAPFYLCVVVRFKSEELSAFLEELGIPKKDGTFHVTTHVALRK